MALILGRPDRDPHERAESRRLEGRKAVPGERDTFRKAMDRVTVIVKVSKIVILQMRLTTLRLP